MPITTKVNQLTSFSNVVCGAGNVMMHYLSTVAAFFVCHSYVKLNVPSVWGRRQAWNPKNLIN